MASQVSGEKSADPYKAKNLDTDASVQEKVKDLKSFIETSKFGMMTTRDSSSGNLVSRCMAVAGMELDIDLIFHTNTESGKTDELEKDPHVNVSFLNSSGEWASVSGTVNIVSDPEFVKKYYSSQLKAWVGDLGDGVHDGSATDPRLGVIKVNTLTATYVVNHTNAVSRSIEVAKGMVTGNTANVHKLRELSQMDIQTWRTSKEMVA